MTAFSLPAPQVVECYFAEAFQPHLLAMNLDWKDAHASRKARVWPLPNGSSVAGPLPSHFGIEVHRHAADGYQVRLLWDESSFEWPSLRRQQLLDSSLVGILEAMGTDINYILDQPVHGSARRGE